ncbi:MAG TPA: M48 family metallopeptidase [Candidatus Binatia bacterium]|nr:M48 family metallopeptidase [Candidatus Binatia bacterium]
MPLHRLAGAHARAIPATLGRAVLLALVLHLVCLAAAADAGLQQGSSPHSIAASSQPLLQYSLPQDKLAKACALYLLNGTLYLVTALWGFIVLWLMLRMRFGTRLRDWAEGASRRRFVQAAIVMSLSVIVLQAAQLPFDMYDHHISLRYGLSVQRWGSWFGDWGKGLLLFVIFATILGWILYAVLRRSPRRWWFYFWLALIPILVFVLFIAPVWIEPLFEKFEPLSDHHADLIARIEQVVNRAGMDIPPQRMFEMKASEKRTTLNAYVSGFGATKRVVVWDTTMRSMTVPETLFVFGHEMGHYVLHHIPKELAIDLAILLLLFYLGYRLANWAGSRYGPGWGVRDLADWASLPMLMLVLSVLTFVATPAFNAVSRHYEHQADQYGLEVIHGLVPEASLNAARAFQVLGEMSLDYPYVGKFWEFWAWNHPTIRDRMIFAQSYDPWHEGRQPEFVKSAP